MSDIPLINLDMYEVLAYLDPTPENPKTRFVHLFSRIKAASEADAIAIAKGEVAEGTFMTKTFLDLPIGKEDLGYVRYKARGFLGNK